MGHLLALIAWSLPSLALAGHLVVEAQPRQVILGGEAPEDVALAIEVRDANDQLSPEAQVVVRSTAGTVADLRAVSQGKFAARLLPPRDRFPHLVVVTVADVAPVVRGEAPVVGSIGIAYSARIDLRGQAEAGSAMRIDVAGSRFGPAAVGRDGRFVLPIVVPPGVGWANAVATDSLGNTARSRINLYLPTVQQLHAFVYPEVLIADGQDKGWLFVTTVDTAGAPMDAEVQVEKGRGELGTPERLGVGRVRWPVKAPAALGSGRDRLAMTLFKGGKNESKASVELELMAGAPAEVVVRTEPAFAPADGASPIELEVEVEDARGNPASGHQVLASLGAATVEAEHVAPGVYRLVMPGRAQVGAVQVPVAVVPRTSQCPRPWAARAPDQTLRVRDVRGIACRLAFAVLDREGKVIHRGATSEMGELSLPAGLSPNAARLVVEGVAGGAPDILWVGGDQVSEPVPIFHRTAVATWRLVSEVTLGLSLVGRRADTVVVEIEATGIPAEQLAERVSIRATRGTIAFVPGEGGGEIAITAGGEPGPLDVVATDNKSGVSAWLRVE